VENNMIKKLEVVRAYSEALAVDMMAAMDYLSDDFHTADQEGNVVLSKDGFVGMGRMMRTSFTDYTWVTNDIREEGDKIIFSGHNEGTHTSDLDLSAMGIGLVPASGKKIVWPEASMKLTVEGDKIVRMEPHGGAAGLQGFLGALGLEPPAG
jgi:predicted ester cyclase